LPVFGTAASWLDETLALLAGIRAGSVPNSFLRHTVLAGPPGTGKSSIVDHLSQRAGVPLKRTVLISAAK
jgi:MoxR-like ATPase